jgi:hypothetical protein
VVHDGVTAGGKPLATEAFVSTIINDTTPAETTVYSGTKTQTLHDAQAQAILNLAACNGIIGNTTSPVFSPIPLVATDLPFTVTSTSLDNNIFEFNDTNNTITFKRVGSYNFFSSVSIGSTNSLSRTITFNIVNTVGGAVLKSQSALVDIQNGSTETLPLNTLLTVSTVPLIVKVQALVDVGTDKILSSFSSMLATSSVSIDMSTVAQREPLSGAVYIGSYTTANRPTIGVNDRVIGYNLTLSSYEGWNGTIWSSVGGGATGGGSDKVFQENDQVVTTNYTLTAGKNAMSAGPVTFNNGISVTVPDGATYTII